MTTTQGKILDHGVLVILIVLVTTFLLYSPVNPLLGSILYFGLPSAYLVFRKPCIFRLALVPAAVFGFIYGIGFEYINEISGSWLFPLASEFVFPDFFFGIVPLDVVVWYILWVFTIVSYYEYFIDRPFSCRLVMRRVYKALGLGFLALGIIAVVEYGFDTGISIPYAYTTTGIAALIPVGILYRRKPHIFSKLVLTIPFLSLFFLVMEAAALSIGYWEFSGDYLYAFQIAGHVIPIEEIILWIVASPLVISAYHELFLDDEK